MVEKLSVQIALEGGKEVEQQLAGIGEAGQKAFDQLEQSATQAGGFKNLKPEEVTQKLKDLGVTGVDSIQKIQDAVKTAGRFESMVLGVQAVEDGFLAVGRAAAALAIPIGVVAVAAVVALTKETIAFAEAINKASAEAIQLGVSIGQFDQLRLGLEAAGISAKGISSGFENFKKVLDDLDLQKVTDAFQRLQASFFKNGENLNILKEAAQGSGKAAEFAQQALQKLDQQSVFAPKIDRLADAFKRLGITTTDFTQALPQAIEQLRQMPDTAQRSALAIQLFGKVAGTELVQALRTGGVAIDQFIQRQGALTQEQENAANRLTESINKMAAAWNRLGSVTFAPTITAGINRVTAALQALNNLVATFGWSTFSDAALAAFNLIAGAISAFTLQGLLTWLAQAILGWTGLGDIIRSAGTAIKDFVSRIAGIVWDSITGVAVAAWNGLISLIGDAVTAVINFATSIATIAWDTFSSLGVKAWNAITGAIGDAISALLRYLGLQGQLPKPGDPNFIGPVQPGVGGIPAAAGGLIWGRGTGTSDSIPAWLSRGEHVMPARAVAQPGVLALLEALRRSGGDLRHVLDGMGRFALGGMVMSSAIPAFARGGLNGGSNASRVLNLTIEGRSFSGLSVPESTAQALERFAVHSQMASTGRRPSWKR